MIKRVGKNLAVLTGDVPEASAQLERDGYAVLRGVLTPDEVVALTEEIEHAFATRDPERGRSDRDEFRYEMLNHGPRSQAAVGDSRDPLGDRTAARRRLPRDREHRVAEPAGVRRRVRGTAMPARTCLDRRVSSGTTASRIPCSRSVPTCC